MLGFPILTASDRSALIGKIRELGRERCAVADLSLGSWAPQSLATQWLGQILGRDVAPTSDAPPMAALRSLGEGMCAGIDEEGRGNRALVTAFRSAQQIARLLARAPTVLIVLIPCHGFGWRRDDRLLIEYLRELAPDTTVVLLATGPAPADRWDCAPAAQAFLPPRNLANALPTALSPTLRAVLPEAGEADLIELANGWSISAPESRGDGEGFGKAQIARFAHPRLSPFRAFALFHAEEGAADPWLLCFEGWRQCHSGYRDLGPILVGEAIRRLDDPGSEPALRAQRQAMRIASSSFEDAALEPAPSAAATDEIAGFIEESRGWGLVMVNRPREALDCLRRALPLAAIDPPDKATLLLMNIAALAELRCGNTDAAFALENAIEARLAELEGTGQELRFVNSINLARLHRYAEDFDGAERYYRRAFATFDGARTETDQVNVNLCFARLEMARDDSPAALDYWIKAALQWCANQCPEALNWRVQALVIGNERRIRVDGHADAAALVERIAVGFLENIEALAAVLEVDLEIDAEGVEPRQFLASDGPPGRATALRAIGGQGWSVLAARAQAAPRHAGPQMQRLRRCLTAWIARQAPAGDEDCYLIDRRDGTDMPGNWREQVASAVDHDVGEIVLADRMLRLDAREIAQLKLNRLVRLNPMVTSVERSERSAAIAFRRYLRPCELSEIELAILDCADKGASFGEIVTFLATTETSERLVVDTISKLREKHIVQLRGLDLGIELNRYGFSHADRPEDFDILISCENTTA